MNIECKELEQFLFLVLDTMRRRRGLTDAELAKIMQDYIPSDSESEVDNENSDDSDYRVHTTAHDISSSESDDNSDSNDTNLYNVQATQQMSSDGSGSSKSCFPKIVWRKEPNNLTLQSFTHPCGAADFVKDMHNPEAIDLFSIFITEEILENIVFQTNLYAEQMYQTNGKPYKATSITEIKAFIGINILMGIKKLPSYRDYWSTAPDMQDPYISQLMTVNRFGWLLSNLHIADNRNTPKRSDPDFDKLYKLRPLISDLGKNFESAFLPSEIVAIDESMIKFKGRSSLKQYLPKKPTKRGYKVWILADKSGYCWKFEIYTGKKNNVVERQLGARVVTTLTNDLIGKNHRVFFDNYFTNPDLLLELLNKQIYACGTVNPTRKNLPKLCDDKKMTQGDYDWATSQTGLVAMKWKDKKCVHLLSNFHDPNSLTDVERRQKDGTVKSVKCPSAIQDYNQNMNCVDKLDQLKGSYEIDRKSHKWWHRIFWYLIDLSVVNAYIVHQDLGLPQIKLKDFRRSISQSLVTDAFVTGRRKSLHKKRKLSQSPSTSVQLKKHKPFVPKLVRIENSAHQPMRSTRRRCAHCSTKKHAKRTDWICSICQVPLCLGKTKNCFQIFHSDA